MGPGGSEELNLRYVQSGMARRHPVRTVMRALSAEVKLRRDICSGVMMKWAEVAMMDVNHMGKEPKTKWTLV